MRLKPHEPGGPEAPRASERGWVGWLFGGTEGLGGDTWGFLAGSGPLNNSGLGDRTGW